MDTTPNSDTQKTPKPSGEEVAANDLVRLANEQGLSLTGSDGLLEAFFKSVRETAPDER